MSAEATIHSLLSGLVAGKVWPDVAPSGVARPFIVYQQVGGQAMTYLEGALPDKENARMQVVCWAATRLAAVNLAKQVEAAIVAATTIQATPLGARVSDYEADTQLYGARQDFSVWTAR